MSWGSGSSIRLDDGKERNVLGSSGTMVLVGIAVGVEEEGSVPEGEAMVPGKCTTGGESGT